MQSGTFWSSHLFWKECQDYTWFELDDKVKFLASNLSTLLLIISSPYSSTICIAQSSQSNLHKLTETCYNSHHHQYVYANVKVCKIQGRRKWHYSKCKERKIRNNLLWAEIQLKFWPCIQAKLDKLVTLHELYNIELHQVHTQIRNVRSEWCDYSYIDCISLFAFIYDEWCWKSHHCCMGPIY